MLPGVPLSLPSGRVIAIEPFMAGGDDADAVAFTARVEPGTYPVVLSEIELIDTDGEVKDSRVAAARLVIRDEPVARWELAVTADQDPSELGDDGYFGYPVDGGTGCFLDAETYRALEAEEDFGDRVLVTMYPCFGESRDGGTVPSPITLAVGEDPTAVVFYSTGFGDGVYATWVGRTAAGEVACFVTDFDTFYDEDEDEDEVGDGDRDGTEGGAEEDGGEAPAPVPEADEAREWQQAQVSAPLTSRPLRSTLVSGVPTTALQPARPLGRRGAARPMRQRGRRGPAGYVNYLSGQPCSGIARFGEQHTSARDRNEGRSR
ncbi:DUF4241 domain-containing protein [Streptomyces sp. M19]